MNVLLASKICETFPHSRIVSFSTGKVYGRYTHANSADSTEEDDLNPDGEYGQSWLRTRARDGVLLKKNNTPMRNFA